MKELNKTILPTQRLPQSLVWEGDELVDWPLGGIRYSLDGSISDPCIRYSYRFDASVSSPTGKSAVIYERLGTKGLLLHEGKVLRELNRSFYHANDYDYPIVLSVLPDGREVLIHCPEEYCRIEIEEVVSGNRPTRRETESKDFFHSRLAVSPDGKYLLSAGWIWHPWNFIELYDLEAVLANPEVLDAEPEDSLSEWDDEINSAVFLGSDKLILAGSQIGVYDLVNNQFASMVDLDPVAGTMMPVGDNHVVGFYEHPKLIELSTGAVVEEWPDLPSGYQNSSITRYLDSIPALALDPANHRFAVAGDDGITVIELG